MSSNRKVAKEKRLSHPKGNPARNPRKRKRADNVLRQRAKPLTTDITERLEHRSPTRVHEISEVAEEREENRGENPERPPSV
jgi:hypothetical protein